MVTKLQQGWFVHFFGPISHSKLNLLIQVNFPQSGLLHLPRKRHVTEQTNNTAIHSRSQGHRLLVLSPDPGVSMLILYVCITKRAMFY